MNRPDAEKLLGGYATGTLTDSEKQILFTAALERQELFDALMDEEALRELLTDPEVRRRLLAALAGPEPVRVPRFWRRPAMLGLAASLFLLATTGLVLWRHPVSRALLPSQPQAEEKESLSKAAGDMESPAAGKATVAPAPSQGAKRARAALVPKPDAKPAPPSGPDLDQPMEFKKEVSSETGVIARFSAAPPSRKDKAPEQQASADAVEAAARSQTPGPVVAQAAKETPGGAAGEEVHLTPVLERLKDGRFRLTVTWGPAGHLYVVKRTPAGAAALPPLKSTPGKGGATVTAFVFPAGPSDVVDVYVLRQAAPDPASLPETEDVPGLRRRVHPE